MLYTVDFTTLNLSVKVTDVIEDTEARRSTRTPRTGRRRGESSTRQDILDAAAKLFAERGYMEATMRAIAAEAGVDAALVVHFFGNKANLLAQAIQWPFDPEVEMPKLLVDGKHQAGKHLVALVVRTWDREGTRNPILTLVRAATTEPQAGEMLGIFLRERLFAPLMERLGSDRPELRANLAATQMVGLGLGRHVLRVEPLASAKPADVVAWYGPTLQRYLTGKLER
jgi:AcrR family transcriptional regulator